MTLLSEPTPAAVAKPSEQQHDNQQDQQQCEHGRDFPDQRSPSHRPRIQRRTELLVRARSAEAASREGLTRAKAADHEFELNSGRRVEVRAFEVDKVFDTHMTELDDLADVGDVQEVFAQLFEVQPKRSDAAASVRRIEFFAPEAHDQ